MRMKRKSLGVKQLTSDPWADILERFPIDSKHKGIVQGDKLWCIC